MATTFYATNNFTGDGTTVNWNINFADGYIDTTNVKARYLDNTGSYVDIAISSVAGNVVTISPAVANGQEFQIYRDTEKRFPLMDFSDGAILNETNLDTLATQAVMVSAEAFDQSNNGVRIAGDSLVIAQGIDAKAQEALDNSEAAVATADGIAATANTALSNSQTALSTANAAKNTADGIAATANTALSNSQTALSTANAAKNTADGIAATANTALSNSQTALSTANAAKNTADGIAATANQALTNSNTAITTANGAVTTANAAASTANGIDAKATQALNNSNTAISDASTALTTANATDGKAQDALDAANAANTGLTAKAAKGANSDITSLTGLTTALSVAQGGTGSNNAGGARINLNLERLVQSPGETQVIAPGNTSYLTVSDTLWGMFDLTAGTWRPLGINQGGTGANTAAEARTNLELGLLATMNSVPVLNGGTGATTVDGARGTFRISQQSGQYGSINNLLTVFNNALPSGGVISFRDEAVAATATYQFGASLLSRVSDTYATFSVNNANGNLRVSGGGVSGGIASTNFINNIWGTRNTTVDVNGFIKQASPIVKIFGNGEYETNIDAEGVTVKRLAEGVYEVSGCLGLNSDASWGGIDGGFEIPIDRNKQPRVWLDYAIKEDGSILVKTYHRTHSASPAFARNELEGFSDGDPIDIPNDAFISVRVEMPSE